MSENSKIEWTDHTFNSWVGCTKVSPACDNCYAESWAKRTGHSELWAGERRRTAESNWKQPLKWNAKHEQFFAEHGRRQRVFCASLADIFDNQVPEEWRNDFWQLVRDTPNLDWLLLTKRPQNIAKMVPDDWGNGYPNVWLGATVENQTEADRRIPVLLQVPAIIRFLSMEPLLGPVDISIYLYTGWTEPPYDDIVHWIITGGESGPNARPSHPDWFRSIRDQCQDAGAAFHFKQWGEWLPNAQEYGADPGGIDYNRKHILVGDDEIPMCKVGKHNAGRLLDGREWNEFPEVQR